MTDYKELYEKQKEINKELVDDYGNQIKTDAIHIRELQKRNGELTDNVKSLEAQIDKMKRCEICKHYQWGSCNYHSNWVKDCKENGMKLFEIKEIKEND